MKNKKIAISKFDIKSILPDSTILILGKRRTGKSWLIRDIFYNHKEIPAGIIFSGTERANPFFSDFIPDTYIHSEYDPELVKKILQYQQIKTKDNGKNPSNNFFIVLDDMLNDAAKWKKDTTIKTIFMNGRHYNIMCILSMQYSMGIPPDLRNNIDYVFIYNEQNVINKKKIYEQYCGICPSYDIFNDILTDCTQDHGCLVVKNTGCGNDKDFSKSIAWYKAKEYTNFKVGIPKFWEFHKKKYNKSYEKDSIRRQQKFDNLNYEKPNKLKIIVSRKGDIENYKQVESFSN